jgi:serine/threonine protein kinase
MSSADDIDSWEADDDVDDETKGDMPFTLEGVTYIKKLGEGGQGKVVLVETKHGQAALKWESMPAHVHYWQYCDMMIEANNLQALGEHPHLIRMIGRGHEIKGNTLYVYLLLELHEGDLYHWFSDSVYPTRKSIEDMERVHPILFDIDRVRRHVAVHIGLALDHLQSKGYIHRDLKPANMGIARDDQPGLRIILCDMGFSRRIADEKGMLLPVEKRDFKPATTWTYASPQTLRDKPQYFLDDAITLVFSLVRDHFINGGHRMFDASSPLHRQMASDEAEFKRNPKRYAFNQQAMLKEMFLADPERFMADLRDEDRPVAPASLPPWLIALIESLRELHPESRVDWPRVTGAISLEEIEPSHNGEETIERSKRHLSPSLSRSLSSAAKADIDQFLASSYQNKSKPVKKPEVVLY